METRCGGTCLITAPGWQTEGDLKFEASLIYTEKACLKSEMIPPTQQEENSETPLPGTVSGELRGRAKG